MASASLGSMDLLPEPDLHPLYPSPTNIEPLLSPHSGLSPTQKAHLVSHCMTRACVFGDLSVLSYLLSDPNAQTFVDLTARDDDGLGLISTAVLGFGSDSERDVEREECVRLLVSQGADVSGDNGMLLTYYNHNIMLTCIQPAGLLSTTQPSSLLLRLFPI